MSDNPSSSPGASTSTDINPFDLGVTTRAQQRKRTLSIAEENEEEQRKRLRSLRFQSLFFRPRRSATPQELDRSIRAVDREEFDMFSPPSTPSSRRSRLSMSTSFSERSFSRASSVCSTMTLESAIGITRSHSVTEPPTPLPVPESAVKNLRNDRIIVDFSVAQEDWRARVWPVGWSENNILVFGRGHRVHYKHLALNEDVGQLCKFREDQGRLRLVACAGKEYPNSVAVCSSSGYIQLWDLATKKMVSKWTTKSATAIQWNGSVLTVGGQRGSIRQFDTRVPDTTKMKEQAKKTMRHQVKITSLAWNIDKKYLASGDEGGQVHIWDPRQQTAPLEVGEMIQRRKKIQHTGVITALAWCPWQPKTLATGDSTADGSGTIRIWNVNNTISSNHPDRLELDAQITSLHFSPHCKELLSTHGPGKMSPDHPNHTDINTLPSDFTASRIANSVVVHSFPAFRRVTTMVGARTNLAGSIISPNGQRVVIAVPEEGKLKIWDVWGKRKELKRTSSTSSLMSSYSIR